MKFNTLCLAGAAALAFVSCSSQQSETTTICGTVADEAIESVRVIIPSEVSPLDTVLTLNEGKFSIDVPTDKMNYGMVYLNNQRLLFIPDGSEIELQAEENGYTLLSDAKTSIHNAFNALQDELNAVNGQIKAEYDKINAKEISDDEKAAEFEKYYDETNAALVEKQIAAVKANPDNFLGLNALGNIYYELEPAELQELINGLSAPMKEHKFVKGIVESLDAKLATQEGQPFTDFEVQTVVGHDRSMDANPVYQTVKLSDYVGKGKYVLVDFWSPWCGPCKREMPNIKAIYEKWHGEKFDVLSVAVWEREDVKVTMETAEKLGVTWNQINNAKDVPTKLYGIDGIPHIILFGPDGTILKRGLHGEELARTVEEYLSK